MILSRLSATLAQLVERHYRKVDVPGSSPGGGSTRVRVLRFSSGLYDSASG